MALKLPTDEIFLTTEEVLEYLSVNLRTVYRMIRAGRLPAIRVGRRWRFRKRDLDAWLEIQRPTDSKAPGQPASRPRVLVVDDEESIRKLLPSMFLNMPGIDGLTLIREAQRLNAKLPAIIITGYSTESSAIEALNLGVAGYLTKPFGTPQVQVAAAKALGSRSA